MDDIRKKLLVHPSVTSVRLTFPNCCSANLGAIPLIPNA